MSTADTQTPVAAAAAAAAAAAPQSVQQVSQPQQQQAVQALAQQASPAPATPQPASATATVAGDSLVCQWASCGERCSTAEQLYDHVCERHVGRKSTNNLNLTCQWGNCRTTTVKRDHITSHIRVHIPLKPHKCDFCGKAFKRPQDLKKHVKTHADDSVLLRSPEPNRGGHGGGGAYQNGPGKLVADLQALAGAASGYYPDSNMNSAGGYPQHGGAPPPGYYSSAPQNSAYGPVYYAVNPPAGMNADYELRKRAAIDALNEFFGDAKRRSIDPTQYYDVGQRLMGLQNIPLAVGGGGGGYHGGDMHHAYSGGGPLLASAGHPGPGHHYSLPLPTLRTKSDLLNIDQFLEQLQSTVYDNPTQAAAAGVAHPGAHYVHAGVNYRGSNSPPGAHVPHSSAHGASITPLSAAPATDTPALTPASSVLSYPSGQSPGSVHSTHTVSPVSRPNIGSIYPTLPSVSAISDGIGSYSAGSAPHSALATSFDADGRRRYSAGLLQKAAPPVRRSSDAMDTSDGGSPTPQHSRHGSTDREGLRHDVHKLALASPTASNVDPALGSPENNSDEQSTTPTAEPAVDTTAQESWIENVRTIEKLRAYIKAKLEQCDFEDDLTPTSSEEADTKPPMSPSSDEHNLYPVLQAVRGGDD